MRYAVPDEFRVWPFPIKTGGLPVGNAGAIGVDENNIVGGGVRTNGEQG
jgi:hypothetical protein